MLALTVLEQRSRVPPAGRSAGLIGLAGMRAYWLMAAVVLTGCLLDRQGTGGPAPAIDASALDGATAHDGAVPDAGFDASAPPLCVTGETREAACGSCGVQPERCEAGAWAMAGACMEEPPCVSGAIEMETGACGRCGTRERGRACGGCEGWGAFGAWSECAGEGVCVPDETRTRDIGCGDCGGTQTVTESCDAGCVWRAISTGACVETVCTHPLTGRRVCQGDDGVFGCEGGGLGVRTCTCDASGVFSGCREFGC